ncbi:MAG TPA: chlorite dismutase family protein [Gemmatimonadales bacterium]|nr:chlorite dismutase family protein [Gemmatimonadales bacterium]
MEQTPQTLNHFALVAFNDAYWSLPPARRSEIRCRWLETLKGGVDALHLYQTFGIESGNDLIVWTATAGDDPGTPARFFARFAEALAPVRGCVTLRAALWGFTLPSQYTKTRSRQELDPFAPERRPYLVMYPFTKTASWYAKSREDRRDMMGEHIKVGKQYEDITQLLLYSTGLQDQEFVVVYETQDLVRFSSLVTELRSTAARPFTERDAPLHTAIHQPGLEALKTWL